MDDLFKQRAYNAHSRYLTLIADIQDTYVRKHSDTISVPGNLSLV